MRPLIVVVGIYSRFAAWNIPAAQVDRLRRDFPHHTFLHARSADEALESIERADVAFMPEISAAQLAAAGRLHWIHSSAAGVGGMLFPDFVASPVVLTNSRGISADTIAEHVLLVTLAVFRKLPRAIRAQAAGEWVHDELVAPPPLRLIAGTRALIVGLGAIGTATAERLAALGAHVTGLRRHASRQAPRGVAAVHAPDRLLDFLPAADIIVLSAPHTHETRHLIGATELDAMREDAILINVSRGKLVDEPALAAALRAGRPGFAALDVFEHEPLAPESPLWHMKNVLITPHMSGYRPDHWEAIVALFIDNLRRFEAGEPLLNVVDKVAGY